MNDKLIIYQMLPRLFSNTCEHCTPNGSIEQNGCGKLNDISTRAIKSIADLGATHIWYTGIIEHATKTDYSAYGIKRDNPFIVKGKAGSPYAIKDYYDIDPDLAVDVPNRMSEFEALVERTHACGLKVIIDFVPNHVARQYHSDAAPCGIEDFGASDNTGMFFNPNNNFYYIGEHFSPTFDIGTGDDAYREFPAKASGNDCFNAHPGICDWYETVKLNYGIDPSNGSFHFEPMPDTWRKMLDILLFWAAKGIDAFRCDMAHMVPVEFWAWAIRAVKSRHPHIKFIAELYDVGIYRDYILRGGFDYLYDKVNLYDTLRAICCNNAPACQITHCWQTVDGIGNHMLNFLENHDEQRFASAHYAGDPWRAIPAFVVWGLFYYSGIHATLSGVAMAMVIPMRPRYSRSYFFRQLHNYTRSLELADRGEVRFPNAEQRECLHRMKKLSRDSIGMSYRMEELLNPYVTFLIMPIFALANAGVAIDAEYLDIFHFSPPGPLPKLGGSSMTAS